MTREPRKRISSSSPACRFADMLGVFSLALGAAELLAPRRLAHGVGSDHPRVVQLYGLREIATGVGILVSRDPSPWIWARVAGDVLDLATLVGEGDPSRRGNRAALAAVAGALALDAMCAWRLEEPRNGAQPHDYSGRVGFPQSPDAMRGAAVRSAPAAAHPQPVE